MGEATEVNESSFEEFVLNSETPVMVDFWAPWCGPCRMLAPMVEDLAKEYAGKLRVVKVNTDDQGALANKYGIRGIPTLVFFKNGDEVDRVVGVQARTALAARIDGIIKDGAKQRRS